MLRQDSLSQHRELHRRLGHELAVLGDLAFGDRQALSLPEQPPLPTRGARRARERRWTVTVAGTTGAPTALAAEISARVVRMAKWTTSGAT